MDLEISRPIGFFRLTEDLGPPKGEAAGEAADDCDPTEGDSREMGLGGAASLVEARGGCSDISGGTVGRLLGTATKAYSLLVRQQ